VAGGEVATETPKLKPDFARAFRIAYYGTFLFAAGAVVNWIVLYLFILAAGSAPVTPAYGAAELSALVLAFIQTVFTLLFGTWLALERRYLIKIQPELKQSKPASPEVGT
jgi:hypothetical protein